MTYQGREEWVSSGTMGTSTSTSVRMQTLSVIVLLAHSANALSTSHLGKARNIMSESTTLASAPASSRARSLLKMSGVPYSNQFSDEENLNPYYERGQSHLARLAQHAQQKQHHSSTNYSYNNNNDLQSALNQELDMMEQKLLQFQESSSRRSQELLDGLEAFSRGERFGRESWGGVNAMSSASTEGPFFGSFSTTDESFGAYDGTWEGSNMNTVVPTAASIAGLSSLGLLRDRMMRRQQKEEEDWVQQDEKRKQMGGMEERRNRRNTRSALSTAAGLGAFAAVGTTNLLSPGGYGVVNQASATSSFASTETGQNPLVGSSRISQVGFGGGIANAATTSNDYGRGSNVAADWNPEVLNDQYNQMPGDSAATSSSSFFASANDRSAIDSSALDSSTSILASEFSRGTYGIYDSPPYERKGPSYTSVDSGFSPPLEKSTPRKSRLVFGGIPMRSLKSTFDSTFVKEKPSKPERAVGQGNVPKAMTLPKKSVLTPPVPPISQSATVSEAAPKVVVALPKAPAIPEKIPLDISSTQPIVKPQTNAIPERIQLTPDIIAEPKKPPMPQTVSEPKVIPDRVDSSPALVDSVFDTLNTQATDGKDDSSATYYPEEVSRTSPISQIIKSQKVFYTGLGAGTFAAVVGKTFQGDTKESKEGESLSQQKILDSSLKTGGSPPDNIDTDQPFTFQSSSAETASKRESNFAIQTPTTSASSTTTQTTSGETRVSVAVETTLEKGSSIEFSAGTDSAGGVSFSEVPGNKQPIYGDAIDTKAVDVPSSQETAAYKTSYLDSLRRYSPTGPTPGVGLQSYLGDLSGASPLSFSTPSMEYSMDQFGTSLDNISQDLDAVPNELDSVTPDITSDLGSISNDLTSVTEDTSSASAALFSSSSTQQYFGSYLENLSQGTPTVCSGPGFTSYLNDLSSTSPLTFDLPAQEALSLTPPDAVESFEAEATAAYSYEQDDAGDFTPKQGSYLESISHITSALGSGQGLTSYLSDLSSAAPLVFDLPEQGSVQSPKINTSVSSYTAPVSDPTNTGRPRRVRVFVEHSVDVQKND